MVIIDFALSVEATPDTTKDDASSYGHIHARRIVLTVSCRIIGILVKLNYFDMFGLALDWMDGKQPTILDRVKFGLRASEYSKRVEQ